MAKSQTAKVLLKILKIIWIPVVIVLAFFTGAYVGYSFITDGSGSAVFSIETWKNFIDQILSLR